MRASIQAGRAGHARKIASQGQVSKGRTADGRRRLLVSRPLDRMMSPAMITLLPAESREERLALLAGALPSRSRVWIVPHDFPDPDALACAGALHHLLERKFQIHSRIVFTGVVSRAENRAMMRHFRYRLWETSTLRPPRGQAPAILVDARPGSSNVTLAPWMRPAAVFDHHAESSARRAPLPAFADVRPDVGACTSIVHEYVETAGVDIPAWLAACMVYAIEAETMDFTRGGGPLDRGAYLSLLPKASLRLLGAIKHAPLPAAYFALLQQAIANARLYGRAAWSHLASVPNPEIVPEIADRLARIERVSHAFCTAFHGNDLLVSVRSNRRHAHCGALIRSVVGPLGSAGGHDRLSAASIPVGGLDESARAELLEKVRGALLRRMEPRAGRADGETGPKFRPLADPSVGPARVGGEPAATDAIKEGKTAP